MNKNIIRNWYKRAKAVEEIYDFFDDDTVDTYNNYKSDKNKNFNVVDFDALQKGEIPTVEIDDDEEYLVDSYGEEKTIDEEEEKDREFDEKMREPYVPPSVDIPSFGNSIEAINDAIKNKKVLKIDYSTKKGIKLTRYVEPHLVYNSKKGELIVVTYDRSVRDIRSFIVNNITNYTLTGKEFKERMRVFPKNENKKVIPKSEKGIKNMSNVNNSLIKVATELKEKGLEKSAIVVDDVIKVIKEAQYVGVQGYWLRNRRCWDNCYRHKRTTEPKKAAQEVWMDCWAEYLKAINNPKDDWAKYASSVDTKVNKEDFNKFNKKFAEEVNSKVDNGMGLPETIYSILNNKEEEYKNEIISQASNLTELAVSLNESGFKDLSIKIAEASNEVLKEAAPQWMRNIGDVAKGIGGDIGRGIANIGKGVKDWAGDKMQGYKEQGDIGRADQLIEQLIKKMDTGYKHTKLTFANLKQEIDQMLGQLRQYSTNPKVQQAIQILSNLKFSNIPEKVQELRTMGVTSDKADMAADKSDFSQNRSNNIRELNKQKENIRLKRDRTRSTPLTPEEKQMAQELIKTPDPLSGIGASNNSQIVQSKYGKSLIKKFIKK